MYIHSTDKNCCIMRHPTLMEDEGRHFLIKTNLTWAEAKQWIAQQKDEYFKPGDYYITQAIEG